MLSGREEVAEYGGPYTCLRDRSSEREISGSMHSHNHPVAGSDDP